MMSLDRRAVGTKEVSGAACKVMAVLFCTTVQKWGVVGACAKMTPYFSVTVTPMLCQLGVGVHQKCHMATPFFIGVIFTQF